MTSEEAAREAGSTVRCHRVLKAPPERVYRAVLDPAAVCKWLPPHGFTCTDDEVPADSQDSQVAGKS